MKNKSHKLFRARGEKRPGKRLPAFVYVVYLLVATVIFTGVTFSGYIAKTTGGDDARTAKYDVSVSSISGEALTLAPDTPASYTFSVTSSSEVAVEYDLVISLPNALPEGVVLSLKRGDTPVTVAVDGTVYTVLGAGEFTALGGTHTYTLTFTATQPIGADRVENISIRVDARQMD